LSAFLGGIWFFDRTLVWVEKNCFFALPVVSSFGVDGDEGYDCWLVFRDFISYLFVFFPLGLALPIPSAGNWGLVVSC